MEVGKALWFVILDIALVVRRAIFANLVLEDCISNTRGLFKEFKDSLGGEGGVVDGKADMARSGRTRRMNGLTNLSAHKRMNEK